jgi:hypothetical protein
MITPARLDAAEAAIGRAYEHLRLLRVALTCGDRDGAYLCGLDLQGQLHVALEQFAEAPGPGSVQGVES